MILLYSRSIISYHFKKDYFQAFLTFWLLIISFLRVSGQSSPQDTSFYINVDGGQLFVRLVGSGTPLVIIHGGPGMSQDYLAPQFIKLLANEYRLIFFDQRASGRSSGVEDTTRLTITQFVADLECLRKTIKLDRMNLVGHSFGGLLAMYYAVAHTEGVEKLLLLDTSPASWDLNFPYFYRTITERQTADDRRQLSEMKEAAAKDPETMDRYLKIFFRTFFYDPQLSDSIHLGISHQWLVNNKVTGDRIWKDLGHYDIHDRLSVINVPVLILHGAASVISVDGAKAIATRIPRSKLILLNNVGHFPYIEDPQMFVTAVKAFFW